MSQASLQQSFSWWCFENRGVAPADLMRRAAEIGYAGVELIPEDLWPLAAEEGLAISAFAGHASIAEGLNRVENAARIERELRVSLEKAMHWNVPVVICFSGNREGLQDEEALQNCAETLSRILPEAEQAGVVLVMELLNSRVDHPDYHCDRSAWGVELCRRVDHPHFKLLFDIYHMQIMEGDLIRTIRRDHSHFGHYHTAGNPGRHDLDADQEIAYGAVVRAIAGTGYQGFLSHEFLPKGDPVEALAAAYEVVAGAARMSGVFSHASQM